MSSTSFVCPEEKFERSLLVVNPHPDLTSASLMRKVSRMSASTEIMTPHHHWLWKSACFLHLYMFHWTGTKLRFQHHLLVWCRLVIHHLISFSSNHPQLPFSPLWPCFILFISSPISFCWFLAIQSHTMTPVSVYMGFLLLYIIYSQTYCFEFSVLTLWRLSFSTFSNLHIWFILSPIFRCSWLGKTNIFCSLSDLLEGGF